jgi:hypothetical protein
VLVLRSNSIENKFNKILLLQLLLLYLLYINL